MTEVTRRPRLGLSLMTSPGFERAARPLFESGRVEALEHTLDLAWGPRGAGPWMIELLDRFSAAGTLYGHGVSFSPLSAAWGPLEDDWLRRARDDCRRWSFRHVTEHFGFQRTPHQKNGAPLPPPPVQEVVRLGRERLAAMARATGTRVGLENLALAFGPEDVRLQGALLEALLAPVDGCLLLDLHNLWCQAVNFGKSLEELIGTYPLARVRQIHLSGGSWSGGIRRDTHDGPIPPELFDFLPAAVAACPRVEVVVMERLGNSFRGPEDERCFHEEFARLEAVLRRCVVPVTGTTPPPPGLPPLVEADLGLYQESLVESLFAGESIAGIPVSLSSLRGLEALGTYLGGSRPEMLEVARELTAKWGRRSAAG